MTTITFSSELKEEILDIFDKTIDSEGFVIEKDTQERVLAFDGNELSLKEFGGIKKGSEVFIKNDLPSLIEFTKK